MIGISMKVLRIVLYTGFTGIMDLSLFEANTFMETVVFKIKKKKTREDLMFKWIYVAFVTGFTRSISPLTRHNLPTD